MKHAFLVATALVCAIAAGCSEDNAGIGNKFNGGGRLMWDMNGRAFWCEQHFGNTYVLSRVPDADKIVEPRP